MSTLHKMLPIRCPNDFNPLKSTKSSSKCHACYEEDDKKQGRKCDRGNFYVHEECINLDIPSRHKHNLELLTYYYECHLCHKFQPLSYLCSQCYFDICIPCARKPLIINQAKAHKHELQQIPMKLSFICDACGLCSSDYPCICHQCCFITHRKCIFLPRVIHINRHDHRVSHVSSLGPGNWICGVCHEPVQGGYGAYSCLICSYAVHSMCATDIHIWDGRELEGIPEKEEGKPFEVIDQNLIKHFSHEHNLEASLGLQEDKHCYACTISFNSERCYRCTQCDFILHDACANLPLRKRHPVSRDQFNLYAKARHASYFSCHACGRYCTGFSYGDSLYSYLQIDVRCASITDAFKHESHPHLLFPYKSNASHRKCTVCDRAQLSHTMDLRCINHGACGGFILCFTCATLPTQLVRHKYDDHPLSLCYGEGNANSTYCCGVCEEEVFPKRGFYWCRDCNSTLHTKCVFKNLLHPRPGYTLKIPHKGRFKLLPNNSLSRPTCYECKNHCIGDLVLNSQETTSVFMCSSCSFPEK